MSKLTELSIEEQGKLLDDEPIFQKLKEALSKIPNNRSEKFMADMEKGTFLTTEAFAKEMSMSTHTIRRWIKEGKIKAKKIGRVWLIYRGELERLAKEISNDYRNLDI